MHERTSRALARLLFVACCAIPTLLTVGTIMVTWTPWYHQRCLRTLESELLSATGLTFSIDDFDRPKPHQMEMSGVRIQHPETGNEVLSVASVIWQSGDRGNVLQVRHPELQASEIEAAVRLMHDRYLCDPNATAVPLELTADGFTIHDGAEKLTFDDVGIRVTPRPSTVLVRLLATLAGDWSGCKIQADVTRDRSGTSPATNWHLSTNTTEIPCHVLSPYIRGLARLGDRATFSGTMGCETQQGRSTMNLNGSRFSNIDLNRFSHDWPHRLSGYADVHFTRCEVREDHSHDVVGEFHSRDGHLPGALIDPLEEHFAVQFADDVRGLANIPYSLVRFGFATDGTRLNIAAMCNQDRLHKHLEDHTLVCSQEQALARMPAPTANASTPAAKLTYLLAPANSPMVPFTPQTDAFLDWLSIDRIAPRDRILEIGRSNQATPPDQVIRMR